MPDFRSLVYQQHRNLFIAGSVVLFHAAAIWALDSGLVRRTIEVVVPVAILSEVLSPPAPQVESPRPKAEPVLPTTAPQVPPPKSQPRERPAPQKTVRPLPAAPQPAAVPEPAPAPISPSGVLSPQPAPAPMAAAVAEESQPAAPAPPSPRFEAPTVDADYAPNEDVFRPPAISARLGEYGTVMLRVTVGVNGQATQVEVVQSSGYARLDNAAVQGAKRLKFRPATRGGIPIEASYQLPVKYTEPK